MFLTFRLSSRTGRLTSCAAVLCRRMHLKIANLRCNNLSANVRKVSHVTALAEKITRPRRIKSSIQLKMVLMDDPSNTRGCICNPSTSPCTSMRRYDATSYKAHTHTGDLRRTKRLLFGISFRRERIFRSRFALRSLFRNLYGS